MKRESWRSRAGFVIAAVGSAVGLVNIWRFPHVVQGNGGAAFILTYLIFLVLIGYPVLTSELLIGRSSQRTPALAFSRLSSQPLWPTTGKGMVITGFIVSSFYSVVAGWILGYLFITLFSGFKGVQTIEAASALFTAKTGSPLWCVGYHLLFMTLSTLLLLRGVRGGIEAGNRIMMPLLVLLLIFLAARGLLLIGPSKGLSLLFSPNWSLLTPRGVLIALGHAFFTLSLGQGTMITYGSYLRRKEHLPNLSWPIVLSDTLISLLAGLAVLSIVVFAGTPSTEGEGLLFATLPTVFAALPGGSLLALVFFVSVLLAAITSQCSAMEPAISALIDAKGWGRKKAALLVGTGAFLLGVPSALSTNLLRNWQVGGFTFFRGISTLTVDILIPLGGLVAVLFVGWGWGLRRALPELLTHGGAIARGYFTLCIRYIAPVLIVVILIWSLVS
ncbi:MAG: sodium-dependent transporter [Parachlamydiales bacterium]